MYLDSFLTCCNVHIIHKMEGYELKYFLYNGLILHALTSLLTD